MNIFLLLNSDSLLNNQANIILVVFENDVQPIKPL